MSTLLRITLFVSAFVLAWPHWGCATARIAGGGGEVTYGPIRVQLHSHGTSLPHFLHRGQIYVVGSHGAAYSIKIYNTTAQRLEVVTSVDGRDVLTGASANPRSQRGYVLNPYAYVDIPGFRTSQQHVATFRFSPIHQSYAARVGGSIYRVGSINVAVFRERRPPIAYIPQPMIGHGHPHPSARRHGAAGAPPPSSSSDAASPKSAKAHPSHAERGARLYRRRRPPYPIYHNPSLGTAYGEQRYAPASFTTFHRATSYPTWQLSLRYNSCDGFRRSGICNHICPCYPRPMIPHYPPPPYTPPPHTPPPYTPPPPSYGD